MEHHVARWEPYKICMVEHRLSRVGSVLTQIDLVQHLRVGVRDLGDLLGKIGIRTEYA